MGGSTLYGGSKGALSPLWWYHLGSWAVAPSLLCPPQGLSPPPPPPQAVNSSRRGDLTAQSCLFSVFSCYSLQPGAGHF